MIQGNEQKLIPLFVCVRMSDKLQLVANLENALPRLEFGSAFWSITTS